MSLYFGQIIIGTAGAGKSTYCEAIQNMGRLLRRNIHIVNLDPATQQFYYNPFIDINDLISTQDVQEELELGPNGSLMYCLEYLLDNFDWLQEQMNDLGQDDYVLFDCPGQIEIFQTPLMESLIKKLQCFGFSLCSIYMLDITFIQEEDKFVSGILMALSSMMMLNLPHLTVLSKCDLIGNKKIISKFLKKQEEEADSEVCLNIYDDLQKGKNKLQNMRKAIKNLVNEYGMVSVIQMDINDLESVKDVIYQADQCIQFGENLEPDDRLYDKQDQE